MGGSIAIEVPLVIAFFGGSLSGAVFTNLMIYRTCYTILHYNKTQCAMLGMQTNNVTEHLEKLVEPTAAEINMIRSVIENCISISLCLFIGPWSDRFGRKPILVACLIGGVIAQVAMAIFSFVESLSPWYLLICSIPTMLTGGPATFMTAVLSYITDVTSEEKRGLRMGIFDAIMAVGLLAGSTSSSYVLAATNYTSIYAISALCSSLSLIFIILFVRESLQNRETEEKVKGFFKLSNMVSMIKSSVKRREKFNRSILLLCALTMIVGAVAMGSDGITFLYLRAKFEWTLEKFNLYNSASSVVGISGTILGIYFLHKLLKIPESILLLTGFISCLDGTLMTALATKDSDIYLGAIFRVLRGVISPMTRSLISKLIPGDEVGKVFSVIVVVQSLVGLVGSPLYTEIYNSTIDKDPAIYNFVTAAFTGTNILITMVIIVLQNLKSTDDSYVLLDETNEEEEPATEPLTSDATLK